MKLVGEAFKSNKSADEDKRVVIMGITTWSTVANRHNLINHNFNKENNVEFELFKTKTTGKAKSEILDPNHSHFILVDDTYLNFGGEIEFRAELEKKITETDKIPRVVLVVGGGPRTAKSVFEALDKKTPCVVLDVTTIIFILNYILI